MSQSRMKIMLTLLICLYLLHQLLLPCRARQSVGLQEVLLEIWEFLSRTFSCRTGVGLHRPIESDYSILIMFV